MAIDLVLFAIDFKDREGIVAVNFVSRRVPQQALLLVLPQGFGVLHVLEAILTYIQFVELGVLRHDDQRDALRIRDAHTHTLAGGSQREGGRTHAHTGGPATGSYLVRVWAIIPRVDFIFADLDHVDVADLGDLAVFPFKRLFRGLGEKTPPGKQGKLDQGTGADADR